MESVRQIARFPAGAVQIPPSKSVGHRALLCAGLAPGVSEIYNAGDSQDIEAMLRCLNALGARARGEAGGLRITGGLSPAAKPLDCGESGTTLRLLLPVAALFAAETVFTGQGLLLKRPLGPYLDAMAAHGMRHALTEAALTVTGPLGPGVYTLPGDISSQYVSGLLFALPLLKGDSEIRLTTPLASASYAGLTLDMLRQFGVQARMEDAQRILVPGGQQYRPASVSVEADYSQAAFFLVASALGCPCECLGLSQSSKQGDRVILDILRGSGAHIETTARGGLIARAEAPRGQTVDVTDTPDLVPPVAALLAVSEGESRITGAGRLRYKECDRLETVADELRGLGADIRVDGDSLAIRGKASLTGGRVRNHNDHRIAMMAAVAAIRCEGPVFVEGDACVAKSYPKFWEDFEKTHREARP